MINNKSIARAAISVALFVTAINMSGCASCSRGFKTFDSDVSGGLNRTVTLYDYSGKEIRSWSGKIDLAETEDEVWFDLDGKRVNLNGGIVVVEEN